MIASTLILLAAAQAAATATTSQKIDPNEVICEKQKVLGSRLASRRVCKTRAQWAEDRLQDRQDLERTQVQRGSAGNQ